MSAPKNSNKFLAGLAIGLAFLFLVSSCNHGSNLEGNHSAIGSTDWTGTNSCIKPYIDSVSSFDQYSHLNNLFRCFYRNCHNYKRDYYTRPLESIRLDELILFAKDRDTALLLYIEVPNEGDSTGYFIGKDIFAFMDSLRNWRFTDHCRSTYYPLKEYTFEQAKDCERRSHFSNGFFAEGCHVNPLYLHKLCTGYCGPCKNRGGAEQDPQSLIFKTFNPPDSLYVCAPAPKKAQ